MSYRRIYNGGGRITDDHLARFNPTDGTPPPPAVADAIREIDRCLDILRRGHTPPHEDQIGPPMRVLWEYCQRQRLAKEQEDCDA